MSRQTAFLIATSPVVRSPSSASTVPAHGPVCAHPCACWRRCTARSDPAPGRLGGRVSALAQPAIDLPADLDARSARLGQPLDPTEFIGPRLRGVPSTVLSDIDAAIVTDDTGGVSTGTRAGHPWITVPKLAMQPEPANLEPIKATTPSCARRRAGRVCSSGYAAASSKPSRRRPRKAIR
jgi:hypothetical protein